MRSFKRYFLWRDQSPEQIPLTIVLPPGTNYIDESTGAIPIVNVMHKDTTYTAED